MISTYARHTAVIGRGIIGLTSALRLAERGHQVVVLGRKTRPKSASLVATGVSAMRGLLMPKTELFRQKLSGHNQLAQFIAALEQQSKQAIPHDFSGAFEFFHNAKTYRALRQRVYHRQASGLFAFKCLNFEQTRARLAECSPNFASEAKKAAFFYPHDGWFDPPALLSALEARLQQLGVGIVDELVLEISENKKSGLAILTAGGGFLVARALVACGADSEDLLKKSGLCCNEFSYSSGLTVDTKYRGECGSFVVKSGADSMLLHSGKVRFGAADISESEVYNSHEISAAKTKLVKKFSRVWEASIGNDFSNEISLSADEVELKHGVRAQIKKSEEPWLGFTPFVGGSTQGVWVATGFHKSGYYMALPSAEKIVGMMEGEN